MYCAPRQGLGPELQSAVAGECQGQRSLSGHSRVKSQARCRWCGTRTEKGVPFFVHTTELAPSSSASSSKLALPEGNTHPPQAVTDLGQCSPCYVMMGKASGNVVQCLTCPLRSFPGEHANSRPCLKDCPWFGVRWPIDVSSSLRPGN